jgi:transposase
VGHAACTHAGAARARGPVGLVAGDRGRLAGGREKGGGQVGRSLRGRCGSRFHVAVDAHGAPFAIRTGPGNENERAHLLPLVDELLERGLQPDELWADRGYASAELEAQLCARGIEPHISKPRRPGEPIPAGTPTREVWRGRRRRTKTRDQNARHRWWVERTVGWLRNWRRVATRWERRPELWLAIIQIAAAITLYQALERSFR